MTKYIILDKLVRPVYVTFFVVIADMKFSFDFKLNIAVAIMVFLIVCFFSFVITDRYLVAFETESGERQLRYRKGFTKKEEVITYTSDAVCGVEPTSKSLFYPLYKFKLYYTSQDGVEAESTFKTNDTRLFNQIMADVYTGLSKT